MAVSNIVLAERVGLQRDWFAQLAQELNLTQSILREKMKDYRASSQIQDDLRKSYPTERGIEAFGSGYPQRHTTDFILSFLHFYLPPENYPRGQSKITFQNYGSAFIDHHMSNHKLAITNGIDAEEIRRASYWKRRNNFIDNELCGSYLLYRNSMYYEGDKTVSMKETEVLHIKRNKKLNQALNAYWWRKTGSNWIFYIGNFYVSSNFLYGTLINRSTDEIIKPVNMCILSKHARKETRQSFIFTGSVTGTDYYQDKIIHYPIAIRRAQRKEIERTGIMFDQVNKVRISNFGEFSELLLSVANHDFWSKSMQDFIKEKRTEYGALDMDRMKYR